jgi:hypothetical protein
MDKTRAKKAKPVDKSVDKLCITCGYVGKTYQPTLPRLTFIIFCKKKGGFFETEWLFFNHNKESGCPGSKKKPPFGG